VRSLPRQFRLREVASFDWFGGRSHVCPWCHTDLTDSIRAHLYGRAMLPAEIRRRAQAAREAARSRSAIGAGSQTRSLSYNVLPIHVQVGDRFSDKAGEWEVASRPYSTAGGKSVNARVRRLDHPAIVEERTWVARERIRVNSDSARPSTQRHI
jgi:hypothetical protein